tara:strand:+ start:46 stop:783 length:738 start_codon:yes stop_codon:yes gene_type:complete
MFVLEFGVNHLGKKKNLNNLIQIYLKSSFRMATIMLQTKKYYEKNPHHLLNLNDYRKIINLCKKSGKKIGLSVCDLETYKPLSNLSFNFYKLLSISNNNKNLINQIKKKNKHIYISTGFSSEKRISNSIKFFSSYKKKSLLHTPMTYISKDLNFNRIKHLKNKYNLDVGYSNHNNNKNTLFALSAYKPNIIFLYIKTSNSKKVKFPDNDHAFEIADLEMIKKNYIDCLNCHRINNKIVKKVKIFK